MDDQQCFLVEMDEMARRGNFVKAAKLLEKRVKALKEESEEKKSVPTLFVADAFTSSPSPSCVNLLTQQSAIKDRRHLIHCSMLYGEMLCRIGAAEEEKRRRKMELQLGELAMAEQQQAMDQMSEVRAKGMRQLEESIGAAEQCALNELAAMGKRRLADVKLFARPSDADGAEQLLVDADYHLDNLLAPELERGLYCMARFSLARKRWQQGGEEKDSFEARAYLNKAIKVFHARYPVQAAKAVKEGALFGEETGDRKLRNLCARIFYSIKPSLETEEGQQSTRD